MAKKYASPETYEKKLAKVMERFGVGDDFNYGSDRYGCFVEFRYKGELYRFDHSVEKAKAHGVNISYGSDAFAQVVLALEDLARMVERGIYDLSTWVSGMKFLPPPIEVPSFFKYLGFVEIPSGAEEVKARYRELAKQYHPDAGGDPENFKKLAEASERSLKYFEQREEMSEEEWVANR
jgi:hypothetical protein